MTPEQIAAFEARKRANESSVFKPFVKVLSLDKAEDKMNFEQSENLRKAQVFRERLLNFISEDERNILLRAWGPINGNTIYEDYLEKRHDLDFKSKQKQEILDKIRELVNVPEFRGSKKLIPKNYKGKGRYIPETEFAVPLPKAPKPLNEKPSFSDLSITRPDSLTLENLTQQNIDNYNEVRDLLTFLKDEVTLTHKNPTVENKERLKTHMKIIEGAIMRTSVKKYYSNNDISRMLADDILYSQVRELLQLMTENLQVIGNPVVVEKLTKGINEILPLFESVENQYKAGLLDESEIDKEQIELEFNKLFKTESSPTTLRVNFYHPNPLEFSYTIKYIDFIFYG